MKTDAMDFSSGGKELLPKRMDCIGNRERNGNDAGFAMGEPCCSVKRPFRRVLADVAAGNVAAERITAATVKKREAESADPQGGGNRTGNAGSGDRDREECGLPNELSVFTDTVSNDGFIARNGSIETDEQLTKNGLFSADTGAAEGAQQIIREALAEISEALGLSIFQGLEQLSLTQINGDSTAQFAEIIVVLRKMVLGFEIGRAAGMAIETPKATVDGDAIDALTDVLRTNAFKIEMACNVLGMTESVQRQIAIKLEWYGSSGIPQATDPATLTMASQHVDRLFGGLFTDTPPTAELALLIEKVKKLLAENGGEKPAIINCRNDSASVPLDLNKFETRVYRELLKIDAVDAVGRQNGEASLGEGKADPLKTAFSAVQLGKNLSSDVGDALQSIVPPDNNAGLQQHALGAEARISTALLRMTDTAIMDQIAGRLQNVIRSGLSEVRLQLRPESLGEVTMRIRMEGDVVAAKIEVQNQQVKEIMERNLPMLREALAQQHLTAGSFDIQINDGFGRHAGTASQEPWNEQEAAEGNHSRKGKEDEDASSEEQQPGGETGRRFGGNSVEYFA
ncbi:MAG: flagellar hook-length control protein FliK [Chitinispirillaceae bacterium]|nr:flagellar hook-length control protein FliK [Chitinispirillaceae bacterium]